MFIEPTKYTPIPTADYPAVIREIEAVDGEYGQQLKFLLGLGQVADVDGEMPDEGHERRLTAYASCKLSPKSKLWGWAQACRLDPEEGLNTADMIGKTVRVTVVVKKRDDGTLTNRVEEVFPPAKGAKAIEEAPESGAMPQAAAPMETSNIPF